MDAVKCPHCACYEMGSGVFGCFILWKTPKPYADRAEPEVPWVKHYALFGVMLPTFFPAYWLFQEWPLLLIYAFGIAGLLMSIFLNKREGPI